MSNKMAHVIYSIDGNVKNKKFPCDNVKLNGPFFEFFNDGELVKVIPVNSIKDIDFIEDANTEGVSAGDTKANDFNSLVLPVMEYMRKNHHPHCTLIATGYNVEIFEGPMGAARKEDDVEVVFDVSDTFMCCGGNDAINTYIKAATDNNIVDELPCKPSRGNVIYCNKMTLMFADEDRIKLMEKDGYKQVISINGKLAYKSGK